MSVLSKAVSAENIKAESSRIIAILMGDSGSGKTQSAVTLPGKTLVIDFEDRSDHLRGEPNIDILKIIEESRITTNDRPIVPGKLAWPQIIALGNELWKEHRKGTLKYDSIMWDSLTRLGRYAMSYTLSLVKTQGKGEEKGQPLETGPAGVPLWNVHYSPQQHIFSNFVLGMIPLPVNQVFTAHVDVIEDYIKRTTKYFPKAYGKIRTELSSWFNEVYFVERQANKYLWHTESYSHYNFLRSAINKKHSLWKSPLPFDLSREPAGFNLVKKIEAKKEQVALEETIPEEV